MLMVLGCTAGKQTKTVDEAPTDSTGMEVSVADEKMPMAADELFDDFIYNFVSNKRLQMERIIFPLKVLKEGKAGSVTKEQWQMERFFMQQEYYTLMFDDEQQMELMNDTSLVHAVVEKIYFETQQVKQYLFDKVHGLWMLTSIQEVPMGKDPNASFLDFYHRFASDKSFQAHSLNATVQFVGPDPDDDFGQMEGVITPDTWEAFAPQLPAKMIYNVVYGEPRPAGNRKIFVIRGISNGFEVEMSFKRVGNSWKLMKLTTS